MRNTSQRVGIFVDLANIYHSAKHLHNANVNFAKLLKQLVGDRQLVRAISYVVSADPAKEKDFLKALSKSGFEIKSKDLQSFPGGMKKGNWDVGMAVDAIRMSSKIDVAIIISGDGDFCDLVEYLQHEGLLVEVVGFDSSTSNILKEHADSFIDLDKYPDMLIKTNFLNKKQFPHE